MSKLITLCEKKPIEPDSNIVGYFNYPFTNDNHKKIITYYNSCNHLQFWECERLCGQNVVKNVRNERGISKW
jgi:hypothetical protein